MKQLVVRRPNSGWLEITLDDTEMDFLRARIDKKGISTKRKLAGNISASYRIEDKDNWFFDNVITGLLDKFASEFRNIGDSLALKNEHPYYLREMWVNYQKQHEFNPLHYHSGIYSFVVWMKIPTDWREQYKLPFLRGMSRSGNGSIKPSAFELSMPTGYDQMIQSKTYHMSPKEEGKMLFFPATMSHQVYPFYESLEDRISISGNIGIDTDIRNNSTGGKEDAKWDKNAKQVWHS